MDNLQLIIFDLDGTLVDSEQAYHNGWVEVLESYGCEVDEDQLLMMRGRSMEHNNQIVKGYLGSDDLVKEARELREAYYFTALKKGEVDLLPGAREIVEAAKAAGLKLGVATSSYRERGLATLEQLDLLKYFEYTVFGDEVAESKPSPEIYKKVLSVAGVSAENAVAIEDSAAGLESALAADLKVFFVPDRSNPHSSSQSEVASYGSLVEVRKDLFS